MSTIPWFRQFFFKLWLWHLLLTLIWCIILLLCFQSYVNLSTSRTYAWANVIGFIGGTVHTLILLIISVRLLARSDWKKGLLFTLHFFISSVVVYALYHYLVLAFFAALFN